MSNDRRFLPLVWSEFVTSRWLALASLLVTFAPIVGGLLSWLLGSPGWLVLSIMIPSPLVSAVGVFLPARKVWQREADRTRKLEAELHGRPSVGLTPSTDGQWAHLEVKNLGPNEAEFEVKMSRIITKGSEREITAYSVRWRDQAHRARKIKAGDSAILNVAEISVPDLVATPSDDLMERALSDKADLRFYSADVPEGNDPFFLYEAPADSDVECHMEIFASPPLSSPCKPAFRLRIGSDKRLVEFEPFARKTKG